MKVEIGKPIRIRPNSFLMNEKQQNLIAQWGLTILLELEGWKKMGGFGNFTSNQDILAVIGLEHLEDEKIERTQFINILKNQREKLANQPAGTNQQLVNNIKKMAKYIGLNNTEQQILLFIVILKEQRGLQEIINLLGDTSVESVVFILSTILNLSPHRTRNALSKNGLLSLSGLLRIDRSMGYAVYDKLDLLDGLSESLQESEGTIDSLLSGYFTLVSPSVLTEENYLYEKNYFTMIKDHLQRACERQDKGVNILVYGPPGTGKTEFAKVVSENIGCKLYEVKIEDDDEPFDNQKRLRAFQLVQQILSRRKNAIILFDEIDSLLSESFSFFRDGNSLNLKSWINKNLENSLVPAIWIANNIDFSESAFIRRFDIVFHLGHPPRSTRLEIMNNYFHGIPIDRKWMVLLADNKYIVPAVIARAANVIRSQSLKNSGG